MSVSDALLLKWRDQGSLRYLATHLGVSTKQVTRFWDSGHIDGCYRTPKGHRRIRYTDATVERVASVVGQVKATNVAIRYHIATIEHGDTVIPIKGCTTMQDVYQRARKTGLDKDAARKAAFAMRGRETVVDNPQLLREWLDTIKRTSKQEQSETMQLLNWVPWDYLLAARDPKDFRARSRASWRSILRDMKSSPPTDGSSPSAAEEEASREKMRHKLRHLFLHPDSESLMSAWNAETDRKSRIAEHDEQVFARAMASIDSDPKAVALEIASIQIRNMDHTPSASALARALGLSRSALYRMYAAREIQAALRPLRDVTIAIRDDGGSQGNGEMQDATSDETGNDGIAFATAEVVGVC